MKSGDRERSEKLAHDIRPALPEDDRAIAIVGDATWRVAYRNLVPDDLIEELTVESRMERRAERRRTEADHRTFVAVTRERGVVGYCSCGPARRMDIDDPKEGEIHSLYVHPEAQGRGLGAKLHRCAEADLIERGFERLRLWVLTENEPSRRFYERMGLNVRIERELLSFAGRELAHTLYGKTLGS